MSTERTSVGLDVHARSVVAAAMDGDTGEVFRARLTPGNDDATGWVARGYRRSARLWSVAHPQVASSTEDSHSGLVRTLGKRVE